MVKKAPTKPVKLNKDGSQDKRAYRLDHGVGVVPKKRRYEHKPHVAYTRALAKELEVRLSAGETLTAICKEPHMPSRQAVQDWVTRDLDGFAERYETARRNGCWTWVDETIEIADDGSQDYVDQDGRQVFVAENVNRSRLRIDTRKWICSAVLRDVFGDKVEVSHVAAIRRLSDEELTRKVIELARDCLVELPEEDEAGSGLGGIAEAEVSEAS